MISSMFAPLQQISYVLQRRPWTRVQLPLRVAVWNTIPWLLPLLLWNTCGLVSLLLSAMVVFCPLMVNSTFVLVVSCTFAALLTYPLYSRTALHSSFLLMSNMHAIITLQYIIKLAYYQSYVFLYFAMGIPNVCLIFAILFNMFRFSVNAINTSCLKKQTWDMYTFFLPFVVLPEALLLICMQDLQIDSVLSWH